MKNENRKHMGKTKPDVIIPTPISMSELDKEYIDFINDIKQNILKDRLKIVLAANKNMILLYWNIGNKILMSQKNQGWGAKVIDRMSHDLKEAFPEMKGFSSRNLKYMQKLAKCWSDSKIVQDVIAQIPWSSNISLMDKIKDYDERLWYAKELIKNGWSKDILDIQISTKLIERQGQAVNNFKASLPCIDSDMATHIFKDPYLFDFLGTDQLRRRLNWN